MNTISLKFTKISEVLPLENIYIIRSLLKSGSLTDEKSYLQELCELSSEINLTLHSIYEYFYDNIFALLYFQRILVLILLVYKWFFLSN